MKNAKGFTLIEVMIVVAIVAILAAVAVPSYQNSIQKTRRAEAKEALTRIAAAQERFFFTNNKYGSLAELNIDPTTENGLYTLSLVNCEGGVPCTPIQFRVQANPTPTSPQRNDTQCQLFVLDHLGRKSAYNAGNDDTKAYCW